MVGDAEMQWGDGGACGDDGWLDTQGVAIQGLRLRDTLGYRLSLVISLLIWYLPIL